MSFLMFCIDLKRTRIVKLNLVAPITQAIFPICGEKDSEEDDEDSPAHLAMSVLNTLTVNISPLIIFPVVMDLVTCYASNENESARKACHLAISILVLLYSSTFVYFRLKFSV